MKCGAHVFSKNDMIQHKKGFCNETGGQKIVPVPKTVEQPEKDKDVEDWKEPVTVESPISWPDIKKKAHALGIESVNKKNKATLLQEISEKEAGNK